MNGMMNTEEICATIPHRPPFLWLDEVVSITDQTIHARKTVTEDLDVFQGHYPGTPLLPGVLQCEMALQASAILIARTQATGEGQIPVATRMNNVKWKQMVRPGDTLDIEVTLTERLQDTFFLTGKISCRGKVTTRLEFSTTATSRPS